MKARYKLAVMASTLFVIAFGCLYATRGVSAAAQGKITGTVKLDGTAPHMKGIDMSKDPYCVKQHESNPAKLENVVVGSGGGLANVVLYISEGLSATEGSAVPSDQPTFDQKGCQYTPHVIALHTGQELQVVNADQTSHNIHPLAKVNREWNKSQPPGSPPIQEKFDSPEFISVKCNIHPWMHGWFAVLKTNHSAITAENGAFSLPNLPPGKYTITAWHEDYGTQTQEVTITGNESKAIDFSFKAKAY